MALRFTQTLLTQINPVTGFPFRVGQIVLSIIVPIVGALDGTGAKTVRPRRFWYI
jgi:hypothetical protein